jgi:pimeloyl-ACP methyl ester carboxylesterase
VLVPFDSATGFSKDAVRARYEAQYAAFPSVKIRMVDNSRHFIMLDAPDAFAAELARLISVDGEQ